MKNVMTRLSFLIILLLSFNLSAFDSPTHFQLFQLSQFPEELLTEKSLSSCKDEASTKLQDFIKKSKAEYETYLADHIHADTRTKDYQASVKELALKTPTYENYDYHIHRGGMRAILGSTQAIKLLQDVVMKEIEEAAQGNIVIWRFDMCAGAKNKEDYDGKTSFSAPGILAGFIYDGIEQYFCKRLGDMFIGGACTFMYIINPVMYEYYQTNEGFKVLRNMVETFLKTINENIEMPNYEGDRGKWVTDVFKLFEENTDQISTEDRIFHKSRIIYANPNFKTKVHDTRLMGLVVKGSYEKHILSDVCPDVLPPESAIFGFGGHFHPQYKKSDYKSRGCTEFTYKLFNFLD